MKSELKPKVPPQLIAVDQLRAGDAVAFDSEPARVIMVEKADQEHVLVAYEGRGEIDYPVGTMLRLEARSLKSSAGSES